MRKMKVGVSVGPNPVRIRMPLVELTDNYFFNYLDLEKREQKEGRVEGGNGGRRRLKKERARSGSRRVS